MDKMGEKDIKITNFETLQKWKNMYYSFIERRKHEPETKLLHVEEGIGCILKHNNSFLIWYWDTTDSYNYKDEAKVIINALDANKIERLIKLQESLLDNNQ